MEELFKLLEKGFTKTEIDKYFEWNNKTKKYELKPDVQINGQNVSSGDELLALLHGNIDKVKDDTADSKGVEDDGTEAGGTQSTEEASVVSVEDDGTEVGGTQSTEEPSGEVDTPQGTVSFQELSDLYTNMANIDSDIRALYSVVMQRGNIQTSVSVIMQFLNKHNIPVANVSVKEVYDQLMDIKAQVESAKDGMSASQLQQTLLDKIANSLKEKAAEQFLKDKSITDYSAEKLVSRIEEIEKNVSEAGEVSGNQIWRDGLKELQKEVNGERNGESKDEVDDEIFGLDRVDDDEDFANKRKAMNDAIEEAQRLFSGDGVEYSTPKVDPFVDAVRRFSV